MQPHSKTSGANAEESSASKDKNSTQKKLVGELKVEWNLLWSERFEDKPKAECVSLSDYERLRVERGDIIHATRDFKALNFKEILKQNMVENPDRFVQPPAQVGGWNKFIKTEITNRPKRLSPRDKRATAYVAEKPKGQAPKKGGRGWLHTT
jgi:hypothetical protein